MLIPSSVTVIVGLSSLLLNLIGIMNYEGLNNYYGLIDSKTGMTEDVDAIGNPTDAQPMMNYRDWRRSVQQRLYEEWERLNENRDLTSDLINLPGTKDGKKPFMDDWFGIIPWRRRPRKLYPDQIM